MYDSSILLFSGVFELNFMSNQPASGYYQFTVAVTGDSRLVANHVEVSFYVVFLTYSIQICFINFDGLEMPFKVLYLLVVMSRMLIFMHLLKNIWSLYGTDKEK